jgi:hypothetical protein
MMSVEKTEHFFGDAVDLETESTRVVIPIRTYRQMSQTMNDDQIFNEIAQLHG